MKKFLKNSLSDVSIKDTTHLVDMFFSASWKKQIIVPANSQLTYLILAKNSTLDVQIEIQWEGASCKIFALCVSDTHPVDVKIITHISASSVKVEKYVLSLLWEDGKVSVDANIDIQKWVKHIVSHLLEENIVFGKNISIKSLPALSVASHDVQASHGAKIEKINQEKLFYMQSKWLAQGNAQTLVVDGYVNEILSHFDVFDEKELSEIKTFVQL